jgi:uncharacterized iron-regulated protein
MFFTVRAARDCAANFSKLHADRVSGQLQCPGFRNTPMKSFTRALLAATTLLATPAMAAAPADVLGTYSDIAYAKYSDSLETAKTLQSAIDKLIAEPTDTNLAAARKSVDRSSQSLPADRSLPLRQCHCRRLGRQGERLAVG